MPELHAADPLNAITHFSDPAAVEAWDAWYRWRSGGELRDVTVDATWARVAQALAAADGERAALCAQRFARSFADWRLLPDERLLGAAGTGSEIEIDGRLRASLNAAAFVLPDGSGGARFERESLVETAALAVHLLDDALLTVAGHRADTPALGIGLIGMGDALRTMALRYDSVAGRRFAADIAQALAEGCVQGSVDLARERGAQACDLDAALALASARGLRPDLIARAARHGLRHARMTSIEPVPRIALLANNVADALDPICDPGLARRLAPADEALAEAAVSVRARAAAPVPADTIGQLDALAPIEMRAAVQPFIDAPIDYPLPAPHEPDAATRERCSRRCRELGLPAPEWRYPCEQRA